MLGFLVPSSGMGFWCLSLLNIYWMVSLILRVQTLSWLGGPSDEHGWLIGTYSSWAQTIALLTLIPLNRVGCCSQTWCIWGTSKIMLLTCIKLTTIYIHSIIDDEYVLLHKLVGEPSLCWNIWLRMSGDVPEWWSLQSFWRPKCGRNTFQIKGSDAQVGTVEERAKSHVSAGMCLWACAFSINAKESSVCLFYQEFRKSCSVLLLGNSDIC